MSRWIIAALVALAAACGPSTPGGFGDRDGTGGDGGVGEAGGHAGGAGGDAGPRRCGEPGELHRVLSWKPESLAYLEGCEVVESLVYVQFYGLADVAMLETIREIRGGLRIDNVPDLTSLRGAESLEHLAELNITSAPLLRSLEPLGGLRQLEALTLSQVPLSNLSGLEGVEEVEGQVTISAVWDLRSLDGLHNLRRVGSLKITSNGGLTSLGALDSLEHVAGTLIIRNNHALPSAEVSDFTRRVRVDGPVFIEDNGP